MRGRTAVEAVVNLRDELRQVTSCATTSVLVVGRGGYRPAVLPHSISFPVIPGRLAGSAGTGLRVFHYYRLVLTDEASARWLAQTVGYFYALDDANGREIAAYHWHPEGQSHVTTPHLHLGAGALVGRQELVKAHLPTGTVTLADVVRLAIAAFAVRPLRPDWAAVLDGAQARLRD